MQSRGNAPSSATVYLYSMEFFFSSSISLGATLKLYDINRLDGNLVSTGSSIYLVLGFDILFVGSTARSRECIHR